MINFNLVLFRHCISSAFKCIEIVNFPISAKTSCTPLSDRTKQNEQRKQAQNALIESQKFFSLRRLSATAYDQSSYEFSNFQQKISNCCSVTIFFFTFQNYAKKIQVSINKIPRKKYFLRIKKLNYITIKKFSPSRFPLPKNPGYAPGACSIYNHSYKGYNIYKYKQTICLSVIILEFFLERKSLALSSSRVKLSLFSVSCVINRVLCMPIRSISLCLNLSSSSLVVHLNT